MAQIEILSEQERTAGWSFQARLLDEDGTLYPVALTLAWADYNLWSPDGADEPQQIALAVLSVLASRQPVSEIRSSLDAALLRRLYDDADEIIPRHIRRTS